MTNPRRSQWMAWMLLAACGASAPDPNKVVIRVKTDRPAALYHVGERARFLVTVTRGGRPVSGQAAAYRLSLDGVGDLGRGVLTLDDRGQATVAGSLDKPGILRCTVRFTGKPRARTYAHAGAAFDPFKIQPTATPPADFDAFWAEQKALLAKIPMNPQLKPVSYKNPKIEVFDITLDNVNGSRVHGYFAKPKGEGPFPAILAIPGAGVSSASLGGAAGRARQGFLALSISVHDLPNGKPKPYYLALRKGKLRRYYLMGRTHRKTYYFYRVFLGCVRAVDYLASRPEWDRKHLIVNGSSQGGGLSLVTAGLDPRVTAVVANVPALCDHSGLAFGRPSGWPRLVPRGKDGKPDPNVLRVAAYYDAVNFARKITVPAVVGVGLIDSTCPATTVFSAYNVLRGPKQIDIAPLMGHSFSPSFRKLWARFVLEQAGLKK